MTQKIDPFIQLNWGWSDGEDGWGNGMNENLIVTAFFHNRRLNDILADGSLLPASPVDGSAYFVNSDKNVYLRADGQWYNTLPPVGMTFVKKTDESVVKYNGTALVADTKSIAEVVGLQTALDNKVDDSLVGAINGVAPLGADGKVPSGYLSVSGSYLGTWNATTNTPTIVSSVGSNGDWYKVSVGGSTTINGVSSWGIGDEIRFNGTIWQRVANTATVSSVNGQVGTVVLDYTDVGAAASSHTHSNATTSVAGFMSSTDKTKLDGISVGATANSSDSILLNRSNHTGTQVSATISDFTEAVQDVMGSTLVAGTNVTLNYNDAANTLTINSTGGGTGSTDFLGLTDTPNSYTTHANKAVRVNVGETALEFVSLGTAAFNNTGDFANASHTHANATTSVSGFFSNIDKIKLDGVASGATANSSDAVLLNRANHTGTQSVSTITGLASVATSASASDLTTGTVSDSRLPATMSGKTFTSYGTPNTFHTCFEGYFPNGVANQAMELEFTTDGAFFGDLEVAVSSDYAFTYASGVVVGKYDTGFTGILFGTGAVQPIITTGAAQLYFSLGNIYYNSSKNKFCIPIYNLVSAGNPVRVEVKMTSSASNLSHWRLPNKIILSGSFTSVGSRNYPTFTSDVYVAGTIFGNGSGLTNLHASNISSGTLADSRLPTTMSSKTFTGQGLFRFNAGASPVYYTGQLHLSDAGSNNPVVLGFHREGLTAVSLVHDGGNNLRLDGTTFGDSAGDLILNNLSFTGGLNSNSSTFYMETGAATFQSGTANLSRLFLRDSAGDFQGGLYSDNDVVGIVDKSGTLALHIDSSQNATFIGDIYGYGAGITGLNASNLSSGTVPTARLPAASTSVAGIVQLGDGSGAPSASKAATENWVYGIAAGLGSLGSLVIYRDKPQQLFQNLGTVSGSVSINSSSGLHVAATVNGNTTWTFPSPDNSGLALSITLELTNGGAYTMTWPAGIRWTGGIAPVLTASGTDILVFTKAGTNNWRGYLSSKDNK